MPVPLKLIDDPDENVRRYARQALQTALAALFPYFKFDSNTPPDKLWEAAIRRLGADPAALQMSRGVH